MDLPEIIKSLRAVFSHAVTERIAAVQVAPNDAFPLVLLEPGESLHFPKEAVAYAESLRATPRRRYEAATMTELTSFCDYVNRFKSKHSAIFATNNTLCAVLDYHPAGPATTTADWCKHTAVYACPIAPEWARWTAHDRCPMAQDAFADFIDANLQDVTSGKGFAEPMALLEMARNLQVHTKGRFERRVDKTTGDFALLCTQDTESTSTPIPRAFQLGVPIHEGGQLYAVEVRLALGVREGTARFVYTIHRRAELERAAFANVRHTAATKTALPVLAGERSG